MAADPGRRRKALEIAQAMEIPKGFLQQLLQELQRAGLVESMSGRTGGYALACAPDRISLLRIVESLEGPIDGGECALRGGPCHWEDVCALHRVWSSAREAFAGELGRATIAQLAADDRSLAPGRRSVPSDAHRRQRRARKELG